MGYKYGRKAKEEWRGKWKKTGEVEEWKSDGRFGCWIAINMLENYDNIFMNSRKDVFLGKKSLPLICGEVNLTVGVGWRMMFDNKYQREDGWILSYWAKTT
jgi:hypothetical protein